jgi:hypothetical protein
MNRTNFAPTALTIIVALVLILVGLIGTNVTSIPHSVGIISFIAATVLLLLGMVFRGI